MKRTGAKILASVGLFAFLLACGKRVAPDDPSALLKQMVDSFEFTIAKDSAAASPLQEEQLRSVTLYVSPLRVEEPAALINGKPVTASVRISQQEAMRLIDVLNEDQFFARAQKLFSERTATDIQENPPPSHAVPFKNRDKSGSGPYRVIAVVFDDHWYTYYQGDFPLSKQKEDLEKISSVLEPSAREVVARLQI